MKNQNTEFEALFNKAWAAGKAAATQMTPNPMAVQATNSLTATGVDFSKPYEIVYDGACGFAWVQTPGNTPFGRWLKKTGKARPGYPTGLTIWIGDYNQSIGRKEAHAVAMANVLKDAGIKCYANSRLD